MTAESDIAAIKTGNANFAGNVRTAFESVLVRADNTGLSGVDTPPASPDAMDDEFDDGSFNTSLWTDINASALTKVESGNRLTIHTTTSQDQLQGIYQSTPSGSWTIRAKIYMPAFGANSTNYAGLFAGQSTTQEQRWIGFFGKDRRALSHSTPTSAASSWVTANPTYGAHLYCQLAWDGTDLKASTSFTGDDNDWFEMATQTLGYTPGIVGLNMASRSGTSAKVGAVFEWFRRVA